MSYSVSPKVNLDEGMHVFDHFCTKNAENVYFDRRFWCAAPKCWSKYTTLVHLKKLEGYSFGTGILVGGWRLSVRKRKVTNGTFQGIDDKRY